MKKYGAWNLVELRKPDRAKYGDAVVRVFIHSINGHALVQRRIVSRNSKFFKRSGHWDLYLANKKLATKAYHDTLSQRPPVVWANTIIKENRREKKLGHTSVFVTYACRC